MALPAFRFRFFIFIWLGVCLFGISGQVASQHRHFLQFTYKEGLPSNEVYYAIQDSRGFIWFGTDAGIAIFDGLEFRVYGKESGIPGTAVFKLYEDQSGRIWVLTNDGRPCYWKNGTFFNAGNDPMLAGIETEGFASHIWEDEMGNIFLSWKYSGLIQITPDGQTIPIVSKVGQPLNLRVYDIMPKDDRYLVAATNNGVFLIDKETHRYDTLQFDLAFITRSVFLTDSSLLFQELGKMYRAFPPNYERELIHSGNINAYVNFFNRIEGQGIFVGVEQGMLRFETEELWDQPGEWFFNRESVSWTMKDREDNIWITTLGSGVFQLGRRAQEGRVYDASDGMEGSMCSGITVSEAGEILVGLEYGRYATINEKGLENHRLYPDLTGKTGSTISHFLHHSSSGDWFIGRNHIFLKTPGGSTRYMNLNTLGIAMLEEERLLFLTSLKAFLSSVAEFPIAKQGIKQYWTERKVIHTTIHSFTADEEGNVYVATDEGLFRYSLEDSTVLLSDDQLLKEGVVSMDLDLEGRLWLAVGGLGVAIWEGDSVKMIDPDDGLSSPMVKHLFVDEEDQVWVTTMNGLNRIYGRGGENKVVCYGEIDGLPAGNLNQVFVKGDQVLVTSDQGLAVLSKQALSKPEPEPVLELDSVNISPGQVLPWSQNSLHLRYRSIDFSNQGGMIFQYRLIGEDSAWHATDDRSLHFNKLAPGDYRFQLFALNREGRTSDKTVDFQFEILPPWWETWWFRISAVLMLISIFGTIFYLTARRVQRQAEFKVRLAEAEHRALRMQMNPHFIFNALNSIKGVYATGDRRKADRYLYEFSGLIRGVLELSGADLISIDEELRLAESYLELNRLRFEDKLTFRIDVPDTLGTDTLAIPPLTIQPIIENAVFHGIVPKDGPGEVHIWMEQPGDWIVCHVRDDGIGRKAATLIKKAHDHAEKSTEITRERLAWFNDQDRAVPDMEIIDHVDAAGEPAGTEVVFYLKPKSLY